MNATKFQIEQLNKICKKFYVNELYLFGSLAKGTSSKDSDIDLLVQFSGVPPLDYFDNYLDFKKTLKKH